MRNNPPLSLDQQIDAARREVEKQEATIAVLKSDVEEDADVSGQLIELLTTLNTQLQKIEAR